MRWRLEIDIMSTSPRSWPFNNKQNIFGNKIVYSPSPLSLHILDDSVIHTLIASLGYIIVVSIGYSSLIYF